MSEHPNTSSMLLDKDISARASLFGQRLKSMNDTFFSSILNTTKNKQEKVVVKNAQDFHQMNVNNDFTFGASSSSTSTTTDQYSFTFNQQSHREDEDIDLQPTSPIKTRRKESCNHKINQSSTPNNSNTNIYNPSSDLSQISSITVSTHNKNDATIHMPTSKQSPQQQNPTPIIVDYSATSPPPSLTINQSHQPQAMIPSHPYPYYYPVLSFHPPTMPVFLYPRTHPILTHDSHNNGPIVTTLNSQLSAGNDKSQQMWNFSSHQSSTSSVKSGVDHYHWWLDIPSSMDLKSCYVNQTVSVDIQITNNGSLENLLSVGICTWDIIQNTSLLGEDEHHHTAHTECPFILDKTEYLVKSQQLLNIKIHFYPRLVGNYCSKLFVRCNHCQLQSQSSIISLVAVCQQPQIETTPLYCQFGLLMKSVDNSKQMKQGKSNLSKLQLTLDSCEQEYTIYVTCNTKGTISESDTCQSLMSYDGLRSLDVIYFVHIKMCSSLMCSNA
ncbi:unnamed protein product [Didymodactylos carnosus]|uniref:Uncharacterized protein n=1 Tax=Didymodactylos carnosus TaxID=1234261 RepID=A0A8S2EIP5_9BILA|nr:unnamed protein product [Didymodactylos carnosus]CAF3995289.1 unnamed protein product [Didymodactylos carnosus]